MHLPVPLAVSTNNAEHPPAALFDAIAEKALAPCVALRVEARATGWRRMVKIWH